MGTTTEATTTTEEQTTTTTTTEEPTTTTEEETTTSTTTTEEATTTTEEATTTTEEETTTTTEGDTTTTTEEETTTTTEEETTTTTEEDTTTESAGRPSAANSNAGKSVTLKEAINAATNRAYNGRGGKARKMRARLFGLSKKALRRKDKKCKLTQAQRETANSGMQNAGNLDEYVQVIFDMFNARTADPLSPPVCDRINLFLKRKINKIVKKTKNQAPSL